MNESSGTSANDMSAKIVGAIDIGSNALRLAIGEVSVVGRVDVLENLHQTVRLGRDAFRRGRLSAQTMRAAVAVLREFKRQLETYNVQEIRAVATSAVRGSSNADAFVDRVFIATGIDVEIIDPAEESRLTVQAAREAAQPMIESSRGQTLIAEVGGGNTLLTVLRRGQIVASQSVDLGSIRLPEMLSTADELSSQAVELLRHQIANITHALRGSLVLDQVRNFIAVGGDVRFAAAQIGKPDANYPLHRISRSALSKLLGQIADRRPEQIAKRYNIAYAEAETLIPALLVYQALLETTGARRLHVCDVTMRDGLLLDLARGVTGQKDEALAQSVIHSAVTLARKFQADLAHAQHVADLAVRLYDEMRAEHGLEPRNRLLLRVAALLHEVGGFVSSRAHHKHSYYLIANSELFGLSREETQMVAHIARYHRRAVPRAAHIEYMMLPRQRRMVVSKLAALLRIADALDRVHAQHVREFDCVRHNEALMLHVHGVSDLTMERRAITAKADLFEDIYGYKVQLIEAPLIGQEPRRAEPVQ